MALDFGVVGDIFERDIGDGDVEGNAGNRIISRGIKGQTEWRSPAEVSKGTTSGWEVIKTMTLNKETGKNVFVGVAVSFDAKSVNNLGSWHGTIKITGVNNGTAGTYKDIQGTLEGFPIGENSDYTAHAYHFLTPDEDEKGNAGTGQTAMNDTQYTVEFRLQSNASVNTMYIKNVIVNLYYIDFDDIADEVIIT